MTRKNKRDIWVKACLYENDCVVIEADIENGGSISDRVALESSVPGRSMGGVTRKPSTMHAPMRLAMTTSYLKTDAPWALEDLQALSTALSIARIGLRLP